MTCVPVCVSARRPRFLLLVYSGNIGSNMDPFVLGLMSNTSPNYPSSHTLERKLRSSEKEMTGVAFRIQQGQSEMAVPRGRQSSCNLGNRIGLPMME